MKKNILLYFFLLHFASVFAGVRIKEFKHPNTYPYNGYILVEANDPQKPYTIVIKGMNSGYISSCSFGRAESQLHAGSTRTDPPACPQLHARLFRLASQKSHFDLMTHAHSVLASVRNLSG